MKHLSILLLAATATSLVIPDQTTLESLTLEEPKAEDSFWQHLPTPGSIVESIEETFNNAVVSANHDIEAAAQKLEETFENAVDSAVQYGEQFQEAFAGQNWLDSAEYNLDLVEKPPPHHGPPHHGPPRRKPHHPPHHGPPNQTIYEMISKSNYTTKFAKLVDEYPDLVQLLNGTKANYTLFVPIDRAFDKIPEHAPKPPKEFVEKLISYHISPQFYPAGRVFASRTIPTALEAEAIGKVPQRLSNQLSLRGLTLNFYARVIAIDVFATNGVIHGIDSILLPPPKAITIINALPGEFSTLELALVKTGLAPLFNDTSLHHGGTLFAPSNFAFKRLGPKINAFLFSRYGLKYLKALLLYHVADDITLYSDAIYNAEAMDERPHHPRPPRGVFHIDLPTGLHGKKLSIDIARYGRLITMKLNAFTRVTVFDGVAKDGVIHVIPNVLIPPKKPGVAEIAGDLSLEEFKERLEPFVEEVEDFYDEEGYSFEL